MKKSVKIIKIIILNLCLVILFVFISDLIIYKTTVANRHSIYKISEFRYKINPWYLDLEHYFTGTDDVYKGRKPDGLEFLNKTPITVFGCSFAHGQHLKYNQTFSYKLSHILKRPVYNRAIPGSSFQDMYEQVQNDYFYKDVPSSDIIFYFMIDDHYRRMLIYYTDILSLSENRHLYLDRKKHLKQEKLNNKLVNIIRSSYTFKKINEFYINNYINNDKNADKITDLTTAIFAETRKKLEAHYGKKVNFVVVFYGGGIKYKDILKQKLEDNNFKVLDTNDLTNEDIYSENYISSENFHPTEEAWNLLTPLIVNELNKNSLL